MKGLRIIGNAPPMLVFVELPDEDQVLERRLIRIETAACLARIFVELEEPELAGTWAEEAAHVGFRILGREGAPDVAGPR